MDGARIVPRVNIETCALSRSQASSSSFLTPVNTEANVPSLSQSNSSSFLTQQQPATGQEVYVGDLAQRSIEDGGLLMYSGNMKPEEVQSSQWQQDTTLAPSWERETLGGTLQPMGNAIREIVPAPAPSFAATGSGHQNLAVSATRRTDPSTPGGTHVRHQRAPTCPPQRPKNPHQIRKKARSWSEGPGLPNSSNHTSKSTATRSNKGTNRPSLSRPSEAERPPPQQNYGEPTAMPPRRSSAHIKPTHNPRQQPSSNNPIANRQAPASRYDDEQDDQDDQDDQDNNWLAHVPAPRLNFLKGHMNLGDYDPTPEDFATGPEGQYVCPVCGVSNAVWAKFSEHLGRRCDSREKRRSNGPKRPRLQ